MDEDKVESIIDERLKLNNGELLKDMAALIKNQISGNKITQNKETPKFKRKSNEEQFKQNEKVICKLQEAETSLESGNNEQVKDSIIEAMDLLRHRQKLIQLADTSDLGWKVVSEYEQNPIADDSDDEKRIYKAEARASRKARAEKSKRGRGRYQPYRKSSDSSGAQASTSRSQTGQYGQRQRPGLCFLCGKAGHWKAECTLNTSYSNNKISSLYYNNTIKDRTCKIPIVPKTNVETKNTENVHAYVSIEQELQSKEIEEKNTRIYQKVKDVLSPVGRLRNRAEVWRKHTDNEYIVNVIESGYKLPFKTIPPKIQLKNNKTARENSTFVNQEIENLLEKGIVREVKEKPHVVNPLTVAYNRIGKPRLVLDCRHINPHLHLFKIKFEDIKLAEQLFDCDSYVFTFDLKSAYHHIDIFEQHKTYLGFSWTENNIERFYVYNSLPFGIAVAGHIFTKVLRVVVKYWRSQGHRVIMFLDDGIGGDADYTHAQQSSKIVRESLLDFGFLLANEKCNWIPAKTAFWLGHHIDFERNRIFISEERVNRLEKAVQSVLFQIEKDMCNCIHVKCLATVVGMIISLQSVLGKVVCRMTKYLYKCILCRASWNATVKVSLEAMKELYYWRENTKILNTKGKCLHEKEIVDMFIYSDASSLGYGGYVQMCKQNEQVKHSKGIESQISKNAKFVSATDTTNNLPEVRKYVTDSSEVNEKVKLYHTASDIYNLEVSENTFENFEIFYPGEGIWLAENTSLLEVGYISKIHAHTGINKNNRYVETGLPEVSCSAEVAVTKGRLPEVSFSADVACTEGSLPEVSYSAEVVGTKNRLPEVSKYKLEQCTRSKLPEVSCSKLEECIKRRLPEVSYCDNRSYENKSYLPKDGKCIVGLAETDLISGSEVYGNWTALEACRSSTWRELEAVRRVLLSNTAVIKNKIIKVFTDNKNVTYILQTGSTIPDLHVLCLEIHEFCIKDNIEIKVDWIPRKLNEKADHLSRCIDVDDWSISKSVFTYLDEKWGPYTIDRFASHYNNHCLRFNSRYWVPNTEGINSLDLDWSGETNWMVPPPNLILNCLMKIEKERCNGTIVVPEWPSSAFWPWLRNSVGTYRKFITDVYTLPFSGSIVSGRGDNGMFKNKALSFRLLALRCSFKE